METKSSRGCEHNYIFRGMVNIRLRGELIGAVDVWKCCGCGNSDVLDRRVGRERTENRAPGFRELDLEERWAILICRADADPEWRVLRVKPGQRVPCACELTGLEKQILINRDFSISAMDGGPTIGHELCLVDDLILQDLELAARGPRR